MISVHYVMSCNHFIGDLTWLNFIELRWLYIGETSLA